MLDKPQPRLPGSTGRMTKTKGGDLIADHLIRAGMP